MYMYMYFPGSHSSSLLLLLLFLFPPSPLSSLSSLSSPSPHPSLQRGVRRRRGEGGEGGERRGRREEEEDEKERGGRALKNRPEPPSLTWTVNKNNNKLSQPKRFVFCCHLDLFFWYSCFGDRRKRRSNLSILKELIFQEISHQESHQETIKNEQSPSRIDWGDT